MVFTSSHSFPDAMKEPEGATLMHSLKGLFRTAIAVVLFLAIASLFTHNPLSADNKKSTAPARGYQVTTGTFDGSQALTACASGYHMASIYEIYDTSRLRYDTSLGVS